MQNRNFPIESESLRELTSHRTAILPVACYRTRIDRHVHGRIPLHWHDEVQWVRVEQGEGAFRVNDEELTLRAGEGLFINGGCLHGAEDRNRSGCVYVSLNAAPHFLLPGELREAYLTPYLGAAGMPYLRFDARSGRGERLLDGIGEVHRLLEQKPAFYEPEIAMLLTRLWHDVIAGGPEPKPGEERGMRSRRVKHMLNWIHDHYAEPVRLEDIARAGGLSRSECCRYFNTFLGGTPLGYVADYRIRQAMDLLRGDANVTETGYRVGFVSTSHFIEKFRLKTGLTPLAYKKKEANKT
ncbi:AraC family transcriptional regulator [Saccharibacillus sp. CPCC 101409]|uniref:helix-turn-helix transcriptional regulator n=1 Tax=Saccharibacillus sp. CPCC 101409 TaxID=3058041 RepID=UPI0026722ACA|nr:AraC family transcriptional regulator [Saccharibacillus sp. CPCC 101409]MDO3409838.1 AraC family transcriptional regulator [Saccharibacillus sp. CPCC 101409]